MTEITLTTVEGFVVGDAHVLEHVGVASKRWRGEGQEDGAGAEEDGWELLGRHDQVLLEYLWLVLSSCR
jgi:hypothetical protein